MRTLSTLLLLVFFNPFHVCATEHTVGSQTNYNSKQDDNLGYGIFYQYKILENIEFEAKYSQSGNLKVVSDEKIILGKYSSFSTGINFMKQRTPKLSLKVGLGINSVTSSSNNFLLEENSISPYFQILTNYKMNESLSLTLGHKTLFHNDAIDTNHSLFISVNWLFGAKAITSLVKSADVVRPLAVIPTLTPIETPANNNIIKKTPQYIPQWYVQIGAYQNFINAQHMNSVLLKNHSLVLTIQLHNKLYRVLSHSFSDKQNAEEYLDYLQAHFKIKGFVNKF